MWDRDKTDMFGLRKSTYHKAQTVFESGREARRRSRKENRKRNKN